MSLPLLGGGPGSGSASAFTPANLSGLIGWWDVSVTASLSLTGSDLNSIADQSGGGNTMNWAGFGKPVYSATGFNSLPAISFDATNIGNALEAASFPMGTGNTLTAFYVGKNPQSGSNHNNPRILSYAKPSNNDWDNVGSWALSSNPDFVFTNLAISRNAGGVSPVNATITNANHVVIATIDSGGVITIYIDGSATTCQTVSGNWVSSGTFGVGHHAAHNSDANYLTGPMAEWGVATGFTGATDVGRLNASLTSKWGL